MHDCSHTLRCSVFFRHEMIRLTFIKPTQQDCWNLPIPFYFAVYSHQIPHFKNNLLHRVPALLWLNPSFSPIVPSYAIPSTFRWSNLAIGNPVEIGLSIGKSPISIVYFPLPCLMAPKGKSGSDLFIGGKMPNRFCICFWATFQGIQHQNMAKIVVRTVPPFTILKLW